MPDLGAGSGDRSVPQQPKDNFGDDKRGPGGKPDSGGSGDFSGSHIPDSKPTSVPGGGTENEIPRQQTQPIPVKSSIPKDQGGEPRQDNTRSNSDTSNSQREQVSKAQPVPVKSSTPKVQGGEPRQDNTRSNSDTSNSQREQVSKAQPKPENNSPKPERTKPEATGIPTSPTPDNNRRKAEPKQKNTQQRGEKPRNNVRGAGIPRRAPKAPPLNPDLNDNRQDRGQQPQDGDSNRK